MELYDFSDISFQNVPGYYLQLINDRPLSKIYHTHNYYEWILVLEGDCVQRLNDTWQRMEAGDLLLLRPGDAHASREQSAHLRLVSLSVESHEFEKAAAVFAPLCSRRLQTLSSAQTTTMAAHARDCLTANDSGTYKLFLCTLLKLFNESAPPQEALLPLCLQRALRQMRQEALLREGTAALVRMSGYSYSHLSRLMKHHLGATPHQFVLSLRLEAAYQRILFTSQDLTDIADAIGFESVSHFVQIFKHRFGETPTALRKHRRTATV